MPDNLFLHCRYKLMRDCWSVDPLLRPTFSVMRRVLENYLTEAMGYMSVEEVLESSNPYEGQGDKHDEITNLLSEKASNRTAVATNSNSDTEQSN